jgi:predicted Rossmann-fold nucleotide-binding protein
MASQQLRRARLAGIPDDAVDGMAGRLSIPSSAMNDASNEIKCCFRGANEELEIEDYAEFLLKTKDKDLSKLAIYGDWVFQEVDYSAETPQSWSRYNFDGCWFWGCTLPSFTTAHELRVSGAHVNENPKYLPFKPFRAFMYTSGELDKVDASIYKFYLTQTDIRSQMFETAHDYSMTDALEDYLEGKAVVAFMGGHAMERHSDEFEKVVLLAWRLSRAGYVVASGGGPGAMAAANMGAYLSQQSQQEVEEALKMISNEEGNDKYEKNYLNPGPEQAVLDRFGMPSHMPSLAIPTWRYGHEPSNRFATYYAKYFSNAIREDALIDVAKGGILYFAGSAGTRQEIFQAACFNHYATADDVTPMVFFDKHFWNNPPLYSLFEQLAQGRPFHKWLLESDDIDEICNHFLRHASERKLPLVRNFAKLSEAHWKK